MNSNRPFADVIPGARGAVLASLTQLATPVSVRSLARHARVSQQAALDHVNDLLESGLVIVERAGTARMVSLNRDHLAAEALTALVELRRRLVERLAGEMTTFPGLAGAWLFGSMARGDGDRASDVDLLLVAETSTDDEAWLDATARLRSHVRAWTGNDAQLVELTRESLTRLVERGSPLVGAVMDEGIPLTPAARSMLRGAA